MSHVAAALSYALWEMIEEQPLDLRAAVPQEPASGARLLTLRALSGLAAAVVAALLMGTPTDVIPNPWFTRMTPVRPLDIVLLVLTSAALGLLAATYVRRRESEGARRGAAGGVLTGLAIGCPVCNKAVVALIGTSGALNAFGPIQPLIGAAGLGLAVWALVLRLRPRQACAVRA